MTVKIALVTRKLNNFKEIYSAIFVCDEKNLKEPQRTQYLKEKASEHISLIKGMFEEFKEASFTTSFIEVNDNNFTTLENINTVSFTYSADWEERLNRELILESERAIKQRDKYLESGVVTAGNGGSHDTCFGVILKKYLKELGINKESNDGH